MVKDKRLRSNKNSNFLISFAFVKCRLKFYLKMKKLILLSILGLFTISASAQLVRGNRPYTSLSSTEGYIMINEFNYGIGLGGHTTPYSTSYYGITSVHGYQVNSMFMVGGGTGLLMYNDGLMIPLFVDMRVRFPLSMFTPYISGEGGMLLNPSDINGGSRMFINPAAGVRYSLDRKVALTASAGLWVQMGPNISRASFVNLKVGAVYKF